jgi:hypothetical protein
MRKALVLIASLAIMALVASTVPSVAAAAPVAKTVKVSAPPGANQACPQQTVKMFVAPVTVTNGRIARPGTFTLVMKNGSKRTVRGSVVADSGRHTAEYFLFVNRTARIKTAARHTFKLKVSSAASLYEVRLNKDCLIAE